MYGLWLSHSPKMHNTVLMRCETFQQRSGYYGLPTLTSCKWFARCRRCFLALVCSPTQTVWRFWALRDCATLLIASLPDGAYLQKMSVRIKEVPLKNGRNVCYIRDACYDSIDPDIF